MEDGSAKYNKNDYIRELEAENERLKAELARKSSTGDTAKNGEIQLHSDLLESLDHALIVADQSLKPITTNKAARVLLRVHSNSAKDATVPDLLKGILSAPALDAIYADVSRGNPHKGEYLIQLPNNESFPCQITTFSLVKDKNQWITLFQFSLSIKRLKASEQKFQEYRKKYNLLAENATDVVWVMDTDFNFTFLSPSAKNTFGYAPGDSMQISRIFDATTIEKASKIFRRQQTRFQKNHPLRPLKFRLEGRHKNGKTITIEIIAKLIVEQGAITGLQGSARDITEKAKANEKLKHNERKYSALFNKSPAMMHAVDEHGYITNASDYWLKKMGYSRPEVIGKKSVDFLHAESRERAINDYKHLCEHKEIWQQDYQFVTKQGNVLDIALSAITNTDEQGRVINRMAVLEDITDTRRTKIRLEERYNSLFENMNAGVAIYKAIDGGKDFVFIDVNKSAERITKSSKAELKGQKLLDKFPNMNKTGLFAALQEVNTYGTRKHLPPFYYQDKNRSGWRENFIYKLSTGEVVTIFHDVTEKQDILQNLIKAKEEAEKSDKLKTLFLRNMSHEIRTPLNGINGFVQLLNKNKLTEKQKKQYTRVILNNSKQLLAIVEDIIKMSLIQTGQEQVEYSLFSLNELFKELKTVHGRTAMNKALALKLDLRLPAETDKLYTDRDKVYQILNNFITNALKFTEAGFIQTGYYLKGNHIHLYVKDSGPGISREDQKYIFDVFWHKRPENNFRERGTGLGLSISKGYAQLMQGDVLINSEPGKGTIAFLQLPYKHS